MTDDIIFGSTMYYQVLRMMHRFSFHSYIHIRLHFNKSTLFHYSTIGAFLSTSDGSTRHIFFIPKYLSNYSNLFKRSDVRRPPPGTRSIFRSRPQHFAFALRQLRHDTQRYHTSVCVCNEVGQKGNIVNYGTVVPVLTSIQAHTPSTALLF